MTKNNSETKMVYAKTALILSVVLVIASVWAWYAFVYSSPQNVFKRMINTSLATYGVTKVDAQKTEQGTYEQKSQLQFGERNFVEVKTTIEQETDAGKTNVVTRTIATPTENFVSYDSIDVAPADGAEKQDFSEILKIWGKQAQDQGGGDVYSDSVYGAVLFGLLPGTSRDKLTSLINDSNVYKIDYNAVKSEDLDGTAVYVYEAEIEAKNYIKMLKLYDEAMNLSGTEGLDESAYEGAEPLKVRLYVGKKSNQLLRLKYGESQDQRFTGYGIQNDVTVPKDAIERQELEGKLETLLTQ